MNAVFSHFTQEEGPQFNHHLQMVNLEGSLFCANCPGKLVRLREVIRITGAVVCPPLNHPSVAHAADLRVSPAELSRSECGTIPHYIPETQKERQSERVRMSGSRI